MSKLLLEERLTERGFEVTEFGDYYGARCSIQQSSLAEFEPPGSTALWIGMDEFRMHLAMEQVRQVIEILQRWVDTGRIHHE